VSAKRPRTASSVSPSGASPRASPASASSDRRARQRTASGSDSARLISACRRVAPSLSAAWGWARYAASRSRARGTSLAPAAAQGPALRDQYEQADGAQGQAGDQRVSAAGRHSVVVRFGGRHGTLLRGPARRASKGEENPCRRGGPERGSATGLDDRGGGDGL